MRFLSSAAVFLFSCLPLMSAGSETMVIEPAGTSCSPLRVTFCGGSFKSGATRVSGKPSLSDVLDLSGGYLADLDPDAGLLC